MRDTFVMQISQAEDELIHNVLGLPFIQTICGVFVVDDVREKVTTCAEL